MKRQDPIPTLIAPMEVTSLFPVRTAMQEKRTQPKRLRNWEKRNRAVGYLIPKDLHLKAKEISDSLLPLASEHLTTVSNVAAAFMQFALSHVHANKLILRGRPRVDRRKLTLHWHETPSGGWPKEIKPLKRKPENPLAKPKALHLAHRWGADIDREIRALSDRTAVPRGEVVVFLLGYALEAYKDGRLELETETIEVANRVIPSW